MFPILWEFPALRNQECESSDVLCVVWYVVVEVMWNQILDIKKQN